MQQTAPLVYDLLLRQYNSCFMAVYLPALLVYVAVLICALPAKKDVSRACLAWLVTGLLFLCAAPLLYRLVVRVYCLMAYGC